MKVKTDVLKDKILKGLISIGYPRIPWPETEIIAASLFYAETHGHNDQGIAKILSPYLKPDPRATHVSIQTAGKVMLTVDGGLRSAVYILHTASVYALATAKEYGVGIAYIHNMASSSGCLGFFAEMIAAEGYEAEIIATTFPKMAPAGGTSPVLGINTIAYGFPGPDGEPRVIDLTTAAMPLMQVINHDDNVDLPLGIGYDSEGREACYASSILADGALRAFGNTESHKGAVLATALQIKGQVIAGASGETSDWGARVQVTALPNIPGYASRFEALERRIKSSKRAPEYSEVRMPGEFGRKIAKRCAETGEVEVDSTVYKELCKLIRSANKQ